MTNQRSAADHVVIVLGRDRTGLIAESMGMRYYLTDCCKASAKGVEGGTACRSCYAYIDDALGDVPDQQVRWDAETHTLTFTPRAIEWVEIFGDGIPHEQFVASSAVSA